MAYPAYVVKELLYPGQLSIGHKGKAVKKLQEWLSLQHWVPVRQVFRLKLRTSKAHPW